MRIFVFILGFIVFILMLRYRGQIFSFTGSISFGEKYFGGTGNLITFTAIAILILSLMYALGTLDSLFGATIGNFF